MLLAAAVDVAAVNTSNLCRESAEPRNQAAGCVMRGGANQPRRFALVSGHSFVWQELIFEFEFAAPWALAGI